jgi:hypothetical protein
MKHLLVGLLIAGAIAACLAWPRSVYGQRYAPARDPLTTWRESSEGLSNNAALAMYRLRTSSSVQMPMHPRFQTQYTPLRNPLPAAGAGVGVAQVPGYTTLPPPRPTKPFEGAQRPPTAFDRYWPLMLEGREDPKTGIIIWSIP